MPIIGHALLSFNVTGSILADVVNTLALNLRPIIQKQGRDRRPFNVVSAYSMYDIEYIRRYTGISGLYLGGSKIEILKNITWNGNDSCILLNSHRHSTDIQIKKSIHTVPFKKKEHWLITHSHGQVPGSCVDSMLHKYLQNSGTVPYVMNIPIFVPTIDLAINESMFEDRMLAKDGYLPYCSKLTDNMMPPHKHSPYCLSPNVRKFVHGREAIRAEKFWLGFADIYHLSCLKYHVSYKDVLDQLHKATMGDLQKMGDCMKQWNKWRKAGLLQNLCWITKHLQKSWDMPETYLQGLRGMYNTSPIF